MSTPISVLIVEDHNLFRVGIRMGCQRDKDIFIAGEALDGEDALGKAAALSPDVILMDIQMPGMNGIESSRLIKERNEKTRIMMLTSQDSEEAVYSALSSGASGYCLKDIDSTLLCTAIKAVHRGETFLDPSLTNKALRLWSESSNNPSHQEVTELQQSAFQTNTKTLKIDSSKNTIAILNPSANADQSEFTPPAFFGDKYECLELLGQGGMSEVYKAKHKLLDKVVAVKFLSKQLYSLDSFAARFAQEARISSRLSHRNIVAVSDFGLTADGGGYLVMEYAEGPSLAETLAKSGRLNESEYLSIFRQLGDALFYSHSKNIIHRDIKPANVILTTDDNGDCVVKLVDFGLAKLLTENGPSFTLNGQILGSPIYMSPEQCQGLELDPRSDIYSLGCLMYEAIAGYPPFRGSSPFDTFRMHVQDKAPDLPEHICSDRFRKILKKCLQKRREDRYASIAELGLDAL